MAPPDQPAAAAHDDRAAFFLADVTTERCMQIAAMIEMGAPVTTVGVGLTLSITRVAHEMLERTRPRPRGKIMPRVAD